MSEINRETHQKAESKIMAILFLIEIHWLRIYDKQMSLIYPRTRILFFFSQALSKRPVIYTKGLCSGVYWEVEGAITHSVDVSGFLPAFMLFCCKLHSNYLSYLNLLQIQSSDMDCLISCCSSKAHSPFFKCFYYFFWDFQNFAKLFLYYLKTASGFPVNILICDQWLPSFI